MDLQAEPAIPICNAMNGKPLYRFDGSLYARQATQAIIWVNIWAKIKKINNYYNLIALHILTADRVIEMASKVTSSANNRINSLVYMICFSEA